MRGAVAKVSDVEASAKLKQAQSVKAMADAGAAGQGGHQQIERSEPLAVQKTLAEIEKLLAGAAQARAVAHKTATEADLAPLQAAHQASMDRSNFEQGVIDRDADRKAAERNTVAA